MAVGPRKNDSKYQKYLASREWALKREAVRDRSEDWCEHCGAERQQAVHHVTYERLYNEPLTDLMAVCNPCHEWLSAKRSVNPLDEFYLVSERLHREGERPAVHLLYQLGDERQYAPGNWYEDHVYYCHCRSDLSLLGECIWCKATLHELVDFWMELSRAKYRAEHPARPIPPRGRRGGVSIMEAFKR